ncbi:protein-glutamine gamma-glutamyltransferase E-like [Acanthochromis polyacanthus]|uniref:protein-glutamine gamma-glutamyltransferase E-like n=1 Tax=Acanthochromis polyacanthus TaxID=80966 RepID=UPI0022343EBD|nr:protein-glutamine gamma-glutamyltransferase E-like [Acanthochromis polyacanthus]
MTEENKPSIFGEVVFHIVDNNEEHHTDEVSQERLVVRRGQNFKMTLTLMQSFDPELQQLVLTAKTGGQHASEDRGTLSRFGYPDNIRRSSSVKAVWKVELPTGFSLPSKTVALSVTPPADAPVGEYELFGKLQDEEKSLGKLVVLFNPWCSEDSVHLSDDLKRQEYILNEHGIIFKGSANYIFRANWDYGQFEENMVDICLKILDRNLKHDENPAEDVASRSDPIYVSRVISAMINSDDDSGVLEGLWEFPYTGGKRPTHWTGSYAILNKWLQSGCRPVKYGQCWVFAGVMCSVMRLLGIPCRVVTNFNSACDDNMNLIIETYKDDDGVDKERTKDSVWNFHVWTEGWMKRPDLGSDGEYDGWQAVDPTPQELSDGVYCCGPASVKSILNGHTEFQYDVAFIYAEVNADYIVWRKTKSGEKIQCKCDTKKVGKHISTKAVGSSERLDITNTYKYKEGSEKERQCFLYATTRDYSKCDDEDEGEEEEEEIMDTEAESGETDGGAGSGGMEEETTSQPPSPLTLRFKEVSRLINGKDVNLNLVLKSKSSDARPLSIHISVQAMNHNGVQTGKILTEDKEEMLLPRKDLSVPILVPFLTYHKPMVESESMRISVVITDKKNGEHKYLATHDVVLLNPPLCVTAPAQASLNTLTSGEVVFTNPINAILTNCTLTLSGCGLFKEEVEKKIEDLKPNDTMSIKFDFTPYKKGEKTLTADFDCDTFRDIKAICTVNVIE